jgi:hypothetical protein
MTELHARKREKYISRSDATRLPEVPYQNYETKTVIHQFMISQDSVLIKVLLSVKMAGHVKKLSISVIGERVLEGMMFHSYGLYFKTMVIKHPKQTTVKRQENTSPEANLGKWKQQKLEGTHQLYVKVTICTDSQTLGCQSHTISLFNKTPKFEVQLRVVCTNEEEQVSFILKVFTMEEVAITLQSIVS